MERIAQNALGASKMVGARRLASRLAGLPGSKPGGSAIPRKPRAEQMASLTGFAPVISCMRGRHVGCTTPQGQKWILASHTSRARGLCFPKATYAENCADKHEY